MPLRVETKKRILYGHHVCHKAPQNNGYKSSDDVDDDDRRAKPTHVLHMFCLVHGPRCGIETYISYILLRIENKFDRSDEYSPLCAHPRTEHNDGDDFVYIVCTVHARREHIFFFCLFSTSFLFFFFFFSEFFLFFIAHHCGERFARRWNAMDVVTSRGTWFTSCICDGTICCFCFPSLYQPSENAFVLQLNEWPTWTGCQTGCDKFSQLNAVACFFGFSFHLGHQACNNNRTAGEENEIGIFSTTIKWKCLIWYPSPGPGPPQTNCLIPLNVIVTISYSYDHQLSIKRAKRNAFDFL